MSWNKIFSDSGFYIDSENGKIKDEPKKEETVIEFKEISW